MHSGILVCSFVNLHIISSGRFVQLQYERGLEQPEAPRSEVKNASYNATNMAHGIGLSAL